VAALSQIFSAAMAGKVQRLPLSVKGTYRKDTKSAKVVKERLLENSTG
jgi:hypothetical protein